MSSRGRRQPLYRGSYVWELATTTHSFDFITEVPLALQIPLKLIVTILCYDECENKSVTTHHHHNKIKNVDGKQGAYIAFEFGMILFKEMWQNHVFVRVRILVPYPHGDVLPKWCGRIWFLFPNGKGDIDIIGECEGENSNEYFTISREIWYYCVS